ncbi:MAG: copper-translocating P-type ATPase [Methylocystaceae bacterium]|nr:copper-translocating P-type ATPase [Methylocystaceae bacterium]
MTHYKFQITGMTCASCSSRIEKVLNRMDGVEEASVNLATEQANVTLTNNSLKPEDLIVKIEKAGFGATVANDNQDLPDHTKTSGELAVLIVCLVLTAPLVAPMLALPFGLDWHLNGWIQLALATPVQIVAIHRFYRSAWGALKGLTGNMDLLVAMGTTAAYGLSLYMLIASPKGTGMLYFEAAAAVTCLILVGKWLENRAKHGVTEAIRALMHLRPETARRLKGDTEESISIDQVRMGDVILVKPGEHIPVDGVIIKGDSEIDESMLTGESLPLHKVSGDKVTGGAINGSGLLHIKTTAVGKATVLSKIIEMIQGAQATKAPVQKLADKIAAIFVPIVCLIALTTFIGWSLHGASMDQALINAITVLVIACPCALGLATPTAIMAGTGVGARHGILIKDAQSLELAHKITTVIFDKTGTLTEGRPKLVEFDPKLVKIAASLQKGSEHSLAKAFEAKKTFEVDDFKATPGHGISGTIKKTSYRLGNRNHMKHDLSSFDAKAQEMESTGMTVVWLEDGDQILGLFGLADTLKKTSTPAIKQLKDQGIISVMLSGDNEKTAQKVAQEVGIETVIAQVLPNEKADHVARLKKDGQVLAMVGDGVNDGPALATADVSFAMASGSDVAVHSAGVTLMRSDPMMIAQAISISKATYRKIQQNLFWAFIYNVIALPAAAFGLLNPMIAGGAMALSSVSVVSNSLLLKRWKPKP